jgi:tripartite ATP-independent transporter DctP family solute receptor
MKEVKMKGIRRTILTAGVNMSRMLKGWMLVSLLVCVFAFNASAAKIIRMGTPEPRGDTPAFIGMLLFEKLVEEKSNGSLEVQLFPSLQLGKIVEQIEGVRDGSQEMMMSTPAWFNRFFQKIDVLSLPYLVTDWKSVDRLIKSKPFKDLLDEAERETGIKIVGAFPSGFRNVLNSVRPVNSMSDLNGLKLRLQDSKVHLATFKALGANPIALPWAEVYLAVQTGVVDGLEIPMTAIDQGKFYEVAPYISTTRHFFATYLIYMNKEFYDDLTKTEQQIVDDSIRAAEMVDLLLAETSEGVSSQTIVSRGGKVNAVSDSEITAMQKAVQPVYEEFGKVFEPTLSQLQEAAAGK